MKAVRKEIRVRGDVYLIVYEDETIAITQQEGAISDHVMLSKNGQAELLKLLKQLKAGEI